GETLASVPQNRTLSHCKESNSRHAHVSRLVPDRVRGRRLAVEGLGQEPDHLRPFPGAPLGQRLLFMAAPASSADRPSAFRRPASSWTYARYVRTSRI